MICFPNAKINLGLHIVSRRPDGYHHIETVFYPIGLCDALEVLPTETVSSLEAPVMEEEKRDRAGERIVSTGKARNIKSPEPYRLFLSGSPLVGKISDNLVIKAWQRIAAQKAIPPIDIHLLKKIPSGAGLGGGSSDAVAMLRLLNERFSLRYSDAQVMEMAAQLGADCPYFLHRRPAFAEGIGNKLTPIALDLSGYHLLVVKPQIDISTKEAYALVTPTPPSLSLKEVIAKPITQWKGRLRNDFESSIFDRYPQIGAIQWQLYEMGALYASMSGSGSSVYAFFEQPPTLTGMFQNCFIWTEAL